jgi:undecaprenyl-diphosphatase
MAVNRLRSARSFGPASEEPYRRRGSDAVRLVVVAVVLALLARRAGRVSTTEASIFQLFNSLPSGFRSLFIALYRLGALWAVALVAVAALGARRWRLARDLSLAGLLAWAIARGLGVAVYHGIGGGLRAVLRFGITPAFPLVRLAVIAAVLAAASPYLTRPTRRIGSALVVALAAAAMYLGTAFPNDLLGALVLGWGVAAAIHFTLGSPGGRPTSPQVAASLAEVGLELAHVRLAPERP